MRIFQINADWDSGGPGTVAKDIYDSIISEGHECKVIYSRGNYPLSGDLIKVSTGGDIKMHALLSRLSGLEGYYSKKNTKTIIELVSDYNPDIIQMHNLLGHYLNFPLWFEFLSNYSKPVVWTIHDCSPFTGHCINFDRIKCEKWKYKCDKCLLYKEYPYSYFFDTSKKVFEDKQVWYSKIKNMHLVVPSEWMKKIVKKSILGNKSISVINNGINLEQFKPIESNIRQKYGLEGKKILLSVAYIWNEMKGLYELKKLASILPEKYMLVIIGIGSEKVQSKNVISIPPISDKNILAKWYTVADIFLNPTLGDNYPTVNIEALSCGTPIITYNTGGSPEIVGDECGAIVYSNSPEEMKNKIISFTISENMKEICRYRAKKFDRNNAYKKYVALYLNLNKEL